MRSNFSLRIAFSDGAGGKISLRHIFEHPRGLAAEIVKGGFFAKCFVQDGALAWPNGFELCPDALRRLLTQQRLKAAA